MSAKIKRIILNIGFIYQFSLDDFKAKYAGSILGIAWAFLQPIITIILYWFIFQLGFKSQPVSNFPFILWLIAGLIPWFFISDSISSATTCLEEYGYLVKKIVFNIDILPLIKVISVCLVQIVLLLFTILIFSIYGYYPDQYYVQILVYLIYSFVLILGIAYFTSTIYVFFKDIIQIVSVILQIIFWTTPIVWDLSIMPRGIQDIIVYSPFYYIIIGFRNIFINKKWFWEIGISETLYYWGIIIIFYVVGRIVFVKCKDHFADIL